MSNHQLIDQLALLGSITRDIYSTIWIHLAVLASHAYQHPLFWFFALFTFRYLRLIVHIISFWCYKPTPIPSHPTLTSQDCTVILPTVDPENPEFIACLQSCLINYPKEILIVTVGQANMTLCQTLTTKYKLLCPNTTISILPSRIANKRTQVALAIPSVQTKISVLLDDHVIWGLKFLPTALAPFENPLVGAVGTNKRVRKQHRGLTVLSYWNMLGALYLERHNFEIRATNALDGGVFVISGRTSLHRTEILQHEDFLPGFTNERFFFGKCGPLNPDDDNYITRFEVARGWRIKVQYSDDACIETTLGAYPKFIQQCLRWVRTTWRSNAASLFTDRTVWRRQPWCVYAVYVTSFFNFALLNDGGLMYLLWISPYGTRDHLVGLGAWILGTKMVKLYPYFRRHPEDLRMLMGYFAFAYFHSLIKGYALLTFWNCHWGGRDLAAITQAAGEEKAATTATTATTQPSAAPAPPPDSTITATPQPSASAPNPTIPSTASTNPTPDTTRPKPSLWQKPPPKPEPIPQTHPHLHPLHNGYLPSRRADAE